MFVKEDSLESLTSLVRVVVTDDSGRKAIAFLSAMRMKDGVRFYLTAKRKDCREESQAKATATFTKGKK